MLPLTLLLALAGTLFAQAGTKPGIRGTVERITVHGKSLEKNLAGDSPDREVSVYLPPNYRRDSTRRYPVIYMLRGFTDDDAKWFGAVKHWIDLPLILDRVMSAPGSPQAIVVMPNAFTRFQGSMYSNSVTTGDWETFVAKELVGEIDRRYRTIASAASRGIAGHSMGGYGSLRIGMKHPDVFSSVYLLSPCCMMPGGNTTRNPSAAAGVEAIRTFEELQRADFRTKAMFASAAAWSPNPTKAPLFVDLPVQNGEVQPLVYARWAANNPLAMVDQYVGNLRRLRAIAFDAGASDQPIATTTEFLDRALTAYQINHDFAIYEGNHVNRIAERIETKVLPFFWKNLSFSGK